MSDTLTILHLSDAHIGKPGCKYESRGVLDTLLDDIEATTNDFGQPNLIVFTGDLVHGNPKDYSLDEQYNLALTFLKNVCQRAKSELGIMPLCLVPGNHDVDRTRVDSHQRTGRDRLDKGTVQKMQAGDDAITWNRTLERQESWHRFCGQISDKDLKWHDRVLATHRILMQGANKIGIAGFNTSWASHGEGEQGKLWFGREQYDAVATELASCTFKIAATHHPLSWLVPDDQKLIKERIETSFDIHLHGHDHNQWYTDSKGHLVAAAGACYETAEKINSYSWIIIDFHARGAEIHFRTYSDHGRRGWGPYFIPGKTNEAGKASIEALFLGREPQQAKSDKTAPLPIRSGNQTTKPETLAEYIRCLQRRHEFRYERRSLPDPLTSAVVYWPVKRRLPTPIHAAQAFTAAGLQQLGCEVHLWIDDLGNTECNESQLVNHIHRWFNRAGGNANAIALHSFKAVLKCDERLNAWKMVEQWLSTRHYKAKDVLEISKIVPERGEPQEIAAGITARRPGRLMTPAMVWACLLELRSMRESLPIITLGGADERRLWDAWHQCVDAPQVNLGHLFVAQLQRQSDTFSMAEAGERFHWTSREDIHRDFVASLQANGTATIACQYQMIPWCLNNCAALPQFVKGAPATMIGSRPVMQLPDFVECAKPELVDDCVEAVSAWIL